MTIFSAISSAIIAAPTAEALFGLWYATASRPDAPGAGLRFSSFLELAAAHAHGAIDLDAPVEVRLPGTRLRAATTAGRVLLEQALPVRLDFELLNRAMNAAAAARVIEVSHAQAGPEAAAAVADALWSFGLRAATESGLSLGAEDLRGPAEKEAIIARAFEEVAYQARLYEGGHRTEGERYNGVVDAWEEAERQIGDVMARAFRARRPFEALASSGAIELRGALGRVAGMGGITSKPGGEINEVPVLHSLAEGLSPYESFLAATEVRIASTHRLDKEETARSLASKLEASLGTLRVVRLDCGTADGITLASLVEGRRIHIRLGRRILGRVLLEAVRSSVGLVLAEAGAIVDETLAERINRALVPSVRVRSPLTCAETSGVCKACYGWDVGHRRFVALRARVGLAAARGIVALAPQLVYRPFDFGRMSNSTSQKSDVTTAAGVARHEGLDLIRTGERAVMVMAREGRVVILDDIGEELESFRCVQGDHILVEDGAAVPRGAMVVKPGHDNGQLLVVDIPEGAEAIVGWSGDLEALLETIVDPVTGLTYSVVAGRGVTLCLAALFADGTQASIAVTVPAGSVLKARIGDRVRRGDSLAVIPFSYGGRPPWRFDLSGGLSRLVDILTAPMPKEPALLAEADGNVHMSQVDKKGFRIRLDPDDGGPPHHSWWPQPHGCYSGEDHVHRGDILAGTTPSPRDLLRLFGSRTLGDQLLAELAELFAFAGQAIAGVHLELALRAGIEALGSRQES